MERIKFESKEIEEPFGRDTFTDHYALLKGNPETFDQLQLLCPRCDWEGKPEETSKKEVAKGDYKGYKRLLCPECGLGLKSEEETLSKVMSLEGDR